MYMRRIQEGTLVMVRKGHAHAYTHYVQRIDRMSRTDENPMNVMTCLSELETSSAARLLLQLGKLPVRDI
jgi:hypothetical protein